MEIGSYKRVKCAPVAPWHDHFNREDHAELAQMLEEGTRELQEKRRRDMVMALRMVVNLAYSGWSNLSANQHDRL